jgi:hypothetical protein
MLPGRQTAFAVGADTWAALGFRVAGSPVWTVAAGVAVGAFAPRSRRLAASAVHAIGAAAG